MVRFHSKGFACFCIECFDRNTELHSGRESYPLYGLHCEFVKNETALHCSLCWPTPLTTRNVRDTTTMDTCKKMHPPSLHSSFLAVRGGGEWRKEGMGGAGGWMGKRDEEKGRRRFGQDVPDECDLVEPEQRAFWKH